MLSTAGLVAGEAATGTDRVLGDGALPVQPVLTGRAADADRAAAPNEQLVLWHAGRAPLPSDDRRRVSARYGVHLKDGNEAVWTKADGFVVETHLAGLPGWATMSLDRTLVIRDVEDHHAPTQRAGVTHSGYLAVADGAPSQSPFPSASDGRYREHIHLYDLAFDPGPLEYQTLYRDDGPNAVVVHELGHHQMYWHVRVHEEWCTGLLVATEDTREAVRDRRVELIEWLSSGVDGANVAEAAVTVLTSVADDLAAPLVADAEAGTNVLAKWLRALRLGEEMSYSYDREQHQQWADLVAATHEATVAVARLGTHASSMADEVARALAAAEMPEPARSAAEVLLASCRGLATDLVSLAEAAEMYGGSTRRIEYFAELCERAGFPRFTGYCEVSRSEWYAETFQLAATRDAMLSEWNPVISGWFRTDQLRFPLNLLPFSHEDIPILL